MSYVRIPKHGQGQVLALCPGLEAPGGIQSSGRLAWEALAERSKSKSMQAQLFCYGRQGDAQAASLGAQVICAASKWTAVRHALRTKTRFDLVLVWHLALLKLLPFFRISGAKVVATLHGIESWKPRRVYARLLLERVDLFLSNSEHTWNRFVSANPQWSAASHRTVHLGTGFPEERASHAPGQPPVALMIGRLVRAEQYKGHREVIAAWPAVLERVPDAELWIVGEGDLRSSLEHLVRERSLANKVRFLGTVSEVQKDELLAHSRCLALPSRGEGFGLVYVEAMRMGRPCLVSTLDAGREVVNPPEAGLEVDPCEPSQTVEALVRMLTPGPQWEAWSRQARRRYETHFTAAHFQRRLCEALFSSAL